MTEIPGIKKPVLVLRMVMEEDGVCTVNVALPANEGKTTNVDGRYVTGMAAAVIKYLADRGNVTVDQFMGELRQALNAGVIDMNLPEADTVKYKM